MSADPGTLSSELYAPGVELLLDERADLGVAVGFMRCVALDTPGPRPERCTHCGFGVSTVSGSALRFGPCGRRGTAGSMTASRLLTRAGG